ncbi:MAG: tRNA (N6-threonylcarbamoyladenosine(37)-N6)-methyltransferase TrmO [Desulfobulbus propionicus]|nr:MAG: tRNA (N6-threonylcarbamoyladenosine(37)-N6)-methyltransferase TrmO [Desulfobulbus propionicus]
MDLTLSPIGLIHSPIDSPKNAPIQPQGAANMQGTMEVYPDYTAGLADLEGFSHLYVLYHFHLAHRTELVVTPFMDTSKRGVFATRSPLRPNHIGISILQLLSIKENILHVQGIDIVDQTPLLDIKPYIHAFDAVEQSRSGWMQADKAQVAQKRSDDRFL